MTCLHKTGEYDLAESGNYGHWSHPSVKDIPWLFYGNMPDGPEEERAYNSSHYNMFGAWRWEQIVLDFKPDIVFSCQDLWMQSVIFNSPLRRFYKIVSMNCIDSEPVREEWLSELEDADYVTGYCDWGLEIVKKYSKNAKAGIATPPGANLDFFKPVIDKRAHKQKAGLDPDSIIFGKVARNQKRKLFPDLMDGFRQALDQLEKTSPDIADKTYLYLHTSYPDCGHNIPALILEHRLSRKVLFTYICHNCKQTFVSFFQDARTFCPKCGQYSAQIPNVGFGVAENVLSDIYNIMDCLIQYSTNEGLGMPSVEGAACGLPLMAVDHTAMSDVVRKVNGIPIRVLETFKEVETGAYKAVPDNKHLAEEIVKFALLSDSERKKMGVKSRIGMLKHFDYNKSAQILKNYFDTVENDPNRWSTSPRLHEPQMNAQGVSQHMFVNWAIANVLGEPERINSAFGYLLNRQFNTGYRETSGTNYHLSDDSVFGARTTIQGITPEGMMNDLREMCLKRNYWERVRCDLEKIPMPRFIEEAHKRMQNK